MPPVESKTSKSNRVWLVARICFPLLVFGYLFHRLDAHALRDSFARVTLLGALGCLLGLVLAVTTGLVRWRLLMRAYGARSLPSVLASARLYWIGAFYNMLPGAVGGDLLRAYSVRAHFEGESITSSLGVVFVERVLGLAGLLALSAASAAFSPSLGGPVLAYALLGIGGASAAIAALAAARRLAGMMPARLGRFLASFPVLRSPLPFVLAALLSIVTHLCIALGGYALIEGLSSQVSLGDALVIFPIGTMAAYFPATVAGAGARDMALVILFERVGVARADVLTTSLGLLAAQVVVCGVGGLVHAFWPVSEPTAALADAPEGSLRDV